MLVTIYRNQVREPRFIAQRSGGDFFVLAWSGDLEMPESSMSTGNEGDQGALSHIFYRFNVDHPDDFRGPSLSVGDIVTLEDSRSYVCLSEGWRPISNFIVKTV